MAQYERLSSQLPAPASMSAICFHVINIIMNPNSPGPLTPKFLFLLQVALTTVFYHSNRKWFCLVEALKSFDIHSVLKYAFLEMVSDQKTDTEKNGIQFYKRWDGTGELVSGCEGGDIEKEYINPFRMGTIEIPDTSG